MESKKCLQIGDKYVNISPMRNTRPISWIKAARKDFEGIKTPQMGVDLVRERLKRLKEALQ